MPQRDPSFTHSRKDFIREMEKINQLQEFLNPNVRTRNFPVTALFRKEATRTKPVTENGHFDERSNPGSPNQLKKAQENLFEMFPRRKSKVLEIHSTSTLGSVFCINEFLMEKRKFCNSLNAIRMRITMLEFVVHDEYLIDWFYNLFL